jgi:hypothetical protein
MRTVGEESISHTTWKREKKDLKKGNPEGHQQTTYFGSPSSLKEFSAFIFTFLFPATKIFTFCSPINFAKLSHFFLPLSSLYGGDKEPVPLDSNKRTQKSIF